MMILRYILKRLGNHTILLTCVLVLAIWLTQSLRFLDMIVNRNVSLKGYFYIIGFLLPDLIVVLLPICLFIVVLFHYTKFHTQHELTVWKSMGLSPLYLAMPALFLSLCVAFTTFVINVYVIPSSFKQFKDQQHDLKQQFSSAMIREGQFNDMGNVVIYVKEQRRQKLYGIFIYSPSAPAPYTVFAKEGQLKSNADGSFAISLYEGVRCEESKGHTHTLHFDHLLYHMTPKGHSEKRIVKPYEKTVTELLSPSPHADQKVRKTYRAAAHMRILQPFFGTIYVLIALCALVRARSQRKGLHKNIIFACTSSFVFHIVMVMLINSNGKAFDTLYVAYGVIVILGVGLLYILGSDATKRFEKVRCEGT